MRTIITSLAAMALIGISPLGAQRYTAPDGALRVALSQQPLGPNPKASAIGFATIPPTDEGGLSIAALNRMIEGAVRGVRERERR